MADDPHLFDNPDLDAVQFLESVMHSPEVSIMDRIKAAEALLPFTRPKLKPSGPTVQPLYVNGVPSDQDVIVKIVIQQMPEDSEPVRQYDGPRLNDLRHRIDNPHPEQKRWNKRN
jgi:hypothetical protein